MLNTGKLQALFNPELLKKLVTIHAIEFFLRDDK